MRVKVLAADVADKIAAGEVVERPASVVKELVENSIDAESSEIIVEVKSGGKEQIRVVDNGIGMEKEDAILSVQRHATSKIRSIDDLFSINSFGFRGEALPSIASVSRFELTSRPATSLEATKVVIDGSIVKEVQSAGAPVGTRVEVSNLFYNIPARLKFLKSETTELNHIINHVSWAAMAHPHIRFRLSHDDKKLIDLPACEDIMTRLTLIYGRDFAENLLKFESDFPSLKLEVYLGNPSLTKPNRNYQLFFLNRRPIRSRTIMAALNETMRSFIPKERFAVAFLFLKVNPSEVDINVHPSKLEVRFKNERSLYSQVVQSINSGLRKHKYIPQITSDPIRHTSGSEESQGRRLTGSDVSASLGFSKLNQSQDRLRFETQGSKPLELELLDFDNVILKTRLFDTYIVAEHEDEVIFIDQHVAHERVLYERFATQFQRQRLPSQGLLIPLAVDLSSSQLSVLGLNQSLLKDIGYEVESFGGKSAIVRAIPSVFHQTKAVAALKDILDQLNSESELEKFESSSIQEKVLITMACRAAVKAGDQLSDSEAANLIKELSQTKLPFNCPHSRPIMISMNKYELETRFGRR